MNGQSHQQEHWQGNQECVQSTENVADEWHTSLKITKQAQSQSKHGLKHQNVCIIIKWFT